MAIIRKWGYKRDLMDIRDRYFTPRISLADLPEMVDLRDKAPPVADQLNLGACTAFGVNGCCSHVDVTDKQEFSYLFTYYNTRWLENSINVDSGAMIRTAVKAAVKYGLAYEQAWKYIVANFKKKAPAAVYASASKEKAVTYARVPQTLPGICGCLASGIPVVFGMSIYSSFQDEVVSKTGIVPMVKIAGESLLGGHCLIILGFNKDKQHFIVRNSWGISWGDAGNCYIPYNYLTNPSLASDFWMISNVQ